MTKKLMITNLLICFGGVVAAFLVLTVNLGNEYISSLGAFFTLYIPFRYVLVATQKALQASNQINKLLIYNLLYASWIILLFSIIWIIGSL